MAKKPTEKTSDSFINEAIEKTNEQPLEYTNFSVNNETYEIPEKLAKSKKVTVKTKEVKALDIPYSLEIKVEEANQNPLAYINEYKALADDILILSKKIITPKDDEENTNARDYGKRLNKIIKDADDERKLKNSPWQEKIDQNNDLAKMVISDPLKKEVERLKNAVGLYETEKERKRLDEEKRLAKEKAEKEAAILAEQQRVAKVRQNISDISTNGIAGLDKCNTLDELNIFSNKVKSYVLKEEFYKECLEEAKGKVDELLTLIEQRRPLLEEIEKAKKEAELLDGEQKAAAEKAMAEKLEAEKVANEEKRKNEELERENKEMTAKQELFSLFASLGIKKVSDYVNAVVEKYGSAIIAAEKREELISDYQNSLVEKAKEEEVASEKVKNVRVDYLFEITDENLIPREYLCVDEAKIKKAIQANREILQNNINGYKISGVMIFPKNSTILK